MACALIAGCGGGSGPSIPIEQLGSEYASVFCHKAFTCCDAAELSMFAGTMTDEATCRSLLAADVTENLASYQTSIDSGRIVYHGERARRCLDALSALACAQWGGDDELRRFPDCLQLFDGKIAAGGPCVRNQECAGGFCDGSTGVGVCAVAPGIGESCASVSCRFELVCLSATTICGTPMADGATCLFDSECASAFCVGGVCAAPTMCNGI